MSVICVFHQRKGQVGVQGMRWTFFFQVPFPSSHGWLNSAGYGSRLRIAMSKNVKDGAWLDDGETKIPHSGAHRSSGIDTVSYLVVLVSPNVQYWVLSSFYYSLSLTTYLRQLNIVLLTYLLMILRCTQI